MAENHIYVTAAGAGAKDGTTWANAMGRAEWETDLEAPCSPDDTYWVEEGTYTLTEDIDCSAINGSSTQPIKIIGVKSGTSNEPPVFADHAFTTDRPLIAAAGNKWWFGDYWIIKNIRVTTTETWGFRIDAFSQATNCKSTDTGGTWAMAAIGSYSYFVGCEADCNAGGFSIGSQSWALSCYAHDGTSDGFFAGSGPIILFGCVADTITGDGIDVNSRGYSVIVNCTIYNCGNGISGTTANCCLIVNNIFDANTVGATWTTAYTDHVVDYNCWDNGTDTNNITKGDNAVTADPGLNDPANADFTVAAGDAVANKALDVGDLTGAIV